MTTLFCNVICGDFVAALKIQKSRCARDQSGDKSLRSKELPRQMNREGAPLAEFRGDGDFPAVQ